MKPSSLSALVTVVGILGATASNVPSRSLSSFDPDATPFVVPSLQEWKGAKGEWCLSKTTRIVVDPKYAAVATDEQYTFMANPSNLEDFAKSFQADIEAVTGHTVEVVVGSKYRTNDLTPIEGIAYPYAVGMWVKPAGDQTVDAVLEYTDGRLLASKRA